MARPIVAWSFSALDMFMNCPRKYWAVKIAKECGDDNKFNRAGAGFHKEAEDYLKKGKHPASPEVQSVVPMFDRLKAAPGQQYVEYDLSLDKDMVPCTARDWDTVWVRGKADYLKIDGERGTGLDWKFGKVKDDDRQATLTAAMVFQHFPDVQHFRFVYAFVKHEELVPFDFYRGQVGKIWNYWLPKVAKLEAAKTTDQWPATPNPLCAWCPYAKCPHNKNKDAK